MPYAAHNSYPQSDISWQCLASTRNYKAHPVSSPMVSDPKAQPDIPPRLAARTLSGKHKAEAVRRLMAGEDAHDVSEALKVPEKQLEFWRREFIVAGERRMDELPLGVVERCLSLFERAVPLATLVSVALGVFLFVQGRHREADARDKEAAHAREMHITESFNALDANYIEYVKLCLQHPELDVFDTPLPRKAPATAEQKREEGMMFAILFSLLEHSYLMYRDQTDAYKMEQWKGWETYIDAWLKRSNFVEEWDRTKAEFNVAFMKYMDGRRASSKP